MAKYQVYIDQNFLVIQECENDGTTTVGLAVNEPAKNVSVSAKVDGDTTKYFFTDKTTGRTIAGGIAVDDMFSDTSGTTYADEAAFIAFYRAQLGKSSAGGGGATLTADSFGTFTDGLSAKPTPVDADLFPISDSADSKKAKKLSWANLKATLKTYFDALYRPALSTATISGTSIDWGAATIHTKTLSASTTFTFSNAANNKQIQVYITNTASNYTVTWPTVDWGSAGAPTQRTGAVTDVYTFIQVGGTIYGFVRQ